MSDLLAKQTRTNGVAVAEERYLRKTQFLRFMDGPLETFGLTLSREKGAT
jgi:hypothetical protein